jgi:ribonuclease P protein component
VGEQTHAKQEQLCYLAPMKTVAKVPVARLKKREDFVRLTQRGEKSVTKGFIMQTLPNEEGTVRLGFTASKKLSKKAVERNRAKRRLRSVSDKWTRLNPAFNCAPMDMCLVARRAVLDLPFDRLEQDLKRELKRRKCAL